jgi:Fe-S-cluster-containing hydrogenase component 2
VSRIARTCAATATGLGRPSTEATDNLNKTATMSIIIKQHVIDPEICIRCNTCEAICPVQAITHDSRNYVVDVSKCNWCNDCISPCPTGSIDNYRTVLKANAYTLEAQFGWDELPAELSKDQLAEAGAATPASPAPQEPVTSATQTREPGDTVFNSAQYGALLPPPLARNLRAVLAGVAPSPYIPQEKTLNLLACGEKYAIASWGNWSAQGRWVWWLKDRIDRSFIRKYRQPAA